jgi:hypothetical protein
MEKPSVDLSDFLTNTFEVGQFIKLRTWTTHRLKIIDKGSIYFIIEHEDRTLGWREIDCDWILSGNQEDWGTEISFMD